MSPSPAPRYTPSSIWMTCVESIGNRTLGRDMLMIKVCGYRSRPKSGYFCPLGPSIGLLELSEPREGLASR